MAELYQSDNISSDNERALNTLARTLKLTQGRFSLVLVRCNYASLRDQMLQRLRLYCTVEYENLVLPSNVTTLHTSIVNQVESKSPAALMVLGLEAVATLDDLLVAANKARDKFKRDCAFPLVLWVTDAVLHKLGRLAPDFNSWASPPIKFTMTPEDLKNFVHQKAEQAFGCDADLSLEECDLETLKQDLSISQQETDPETQAILALIRGLIDYRNNQVDSAIAHYQQSLPFWQQNNHLERQARLLLNIALAYERKAERQRTDNTNYWEDTRNYLQQSLEIFEQAQRPELVAKYTSQLCQVLRRLQAWEKLHNLAQKALQLHQNYGQLSQVAQDYGLLAEVALAQSHWDEARQLAQQALATLEAIPNFQPQEQGFYHYLLAKSLWQLNQINEAVSHLEKARNESQPQYEPVLYVKILEELRYLYFEQKHYEKAFHLKLKQREIESQYGMRAFIGAGRLQPRPQVVHAPKSTHQQPIAKVEETIAAFGRQQDVERLIHRIGRNDYKLTVIYGQSGVGKSSIVQAGLLPALQLNSFDGRDTLPVLVQVYTAWEKECGRHLAEKLTEIRSIQLSAPLETSAAIIEQLHENEKRHLLTVIIFDQFEEFFFVDKDQVNRRPLYDFLCGCLNIPYVKVILSLRQDYLHYLLEWNRTTKLPIIDDDILHKNIIYYLGNFSPSDAKYVIKSLTENSKFYLEADLIDALVEDLAGELQEVRPIELQVVGAQLQAEKITTLEQYRKNWLKEKLVERYLEEVVKDCGAENERAAQLVLYLLTDENHTRPLKKRAELERDLVTEAQNLDLVLDILVGSGLVFRIPESPGDRYQLVHDYLVPFIRQQRSAELLTKLKEAEAELNRVLQQQLRTARRTGIGLATLAATATIFGIISLTAFINGTDSQLNTMSAVSDGRLASYQDMEALLEGIRAGRKLQQWKIGIQEKTKTQVVAALQQVVYDIRELNTLEGHSDRVNTVSFSPDGNWIASGSADTTIKLWNVQTKVPKNLEGHSKSVTSVSFSPNGQTIASGSEDGTVRLWNLEGKEIDKYETKLQKISHLSFSPNGKMIVFGSQDGTVKLINLQTRKVINFSNSHENIISIKFSPDGNKIVSRDRHGFLTISNLNGKEINTLFPDDKIYGIRFNVGAPNITTVGQGIFKRLRSDSSLKNKILLLPNFIPYQLSDFNPDSTIQTSISGLSIRLQFLDGGGSKYLQGHRNDVTNLSFSPNGKMLASASADNTVKLWDIASRKFLSPDGRLVSNVSFSPNKNNPIIASTSRDDDGKNSRVQIWQRDGNLLSILPGNNSTVSFSKNSQTLASASYDYTVQLWRHDGTFLKTLQGRVVDGSFSPDGQTIALVRDNYNVELSGIDGKQISTLKGHKDQVYEIKFSQDGQTIVTASKDETIRIWQRDGTHLKRLDGYGDRVEKMNLSFNGDTLAILVNDNTVKFLRRNGTQIASLLGEGNRHMEVNFSPDQKMLAISNRDNNPNSIELWTIDGTRLTKLLEKSKSLDFRYFCSDNQTIVTTSIDGTVQQFWRRNGTLVSTLNQSVTHFSPNCQTLVTREEDTNKVQIRQKNGTLINTLSLKSKSLANDFVVYFSPDGKTLGIRTDNNTLELWRIEGIFLGTIQSQDAHQIGSDFSSNGKTLTIHTDDNKVELTQVDGKPIKKLLTLPEHERNWVNSVQFIPKSETIAIVGGYYTLKYWKIPNKTGSKVQPSQTFPGHKDWINSVSLSPDGKTIASASNDKTVRFWHLDGTQSKPIKHNEKVKSVNFSPDGEIIASASGKFIQLWQGDGTPIETKTPLEHGNTVNRVIFSPDGKLIASASNDQRIGLWKLDGTNIRFLKDNYPVTGISFRPDGKVLASASSETVKLWSVDSGELLATYRRFGKRDVSFSPDGKSIAAASYNAVSLWDFDLNKLLKDGCKRAKDYLTNNPNIKNSDRELCKY